MKSTNLKRFGAAALSGAMALSMAAPAFAADTPPNTTTTVTSTYQAITLNVTVPSVGTAQINPYGLPIELKSGAEGAETVDAVISGEQITTATPLVISNQSRVALAVTAKVTGAEDSQGGAKLVEDLTANVTESSTPKNIVAKFEAFPAPDYSGVVSDIEQSDINTWFSELNSANAVLTAPVLTTATDTTGTLVLREGEEVDVDDTTKAWVPQSGSAAFIRLSGNVVKSPTLPWDGKDKFTATIAFTFEPSEYVGTVQLSGAEEVAVGATADITVALPDGVKAKMNTIKWTSSKTANVTVVDKSTADSTAPTTASAVAGTVTGVKSSTTKATITVEFEGTDGVIYRGTALVKCA